MAKTDLGKKRICPETGKKFYDLNKDPIVSPFTGNEYPLSFFEDDTAKAPEPSKSDLKKDEKAAVKEKPEAEDEDDEEEDDVPEIDEAETVSLEDADEDDSDDDDSDDDDVLLGDDEDDIDLDDDDDDGVLLDDDEDDDDFGIGGEEDDDD